MKEHVYTTEGSKVIDLLVGFFLFGGLSQPLFRFFLGKANGESPMGLLFVFIFAWVAVAAYLYGKRRYMGIGIIVGLGLSALSVSPYLLIIFFGN